MAQMTDYLENLLIRHLFCTATYTKPTFLGIVLSTSNSLDDTASGSACNEVTIASGYGRMSLGPLDANWTTPVATGANSGKVDNAGAINFTVASGSWGTVNSVVITDNHTQSVGNALFYGTLSVAKAVTSGDTFSFAANALSITIDN